MILRLRFLASGQSFEDLKFLTAISPQSLGLIVMETCSAVIEVRIPKTEEEWISVSEEFGSRWNFPNCIGAIDGKHVEIRKPVCSGSYYFNYKKTFSIVLFAVVNENYEFIMVEAGANGRVSDGGVFSNSAFYEKFKDNLFHVPDSGEIPNYKKEMPFVLVGDDAFTMTRNLMKPYKEEVLSDEKIIFNYRLSRARHTVENAFGILSSRFRVLSNKINLSPEKATTITVAACHLHNYLRKRNPSVYLRGSVDFENTSTGEMELGSWRANSQQMTTLKPTQSRNSTSIAKETRNNFCTYFNGVGAVPWQYMHLRKSGKK